MFVNCEDMALRDMVRVDWWLDLRILVVLSDQNQPMILCTCCDRDEENSKERWQKDVKWL